MGFMDPPTKPNIYYQIFPTESNGIPHQQQNQQPKNIKQKYGACT